MHCPEFLLSTSYLCCCSPSTPTFGGGGGSLFKDGSITSSLQAAKEAAAAEHEAAEENGKEQEQVAFLIDAAFWGPTEFSWHGSTAMMRLHSLQPVKKANKPFALSAMASQGWDL